MTPAVAADDGAAGPPAALGGQPTASAAEASEEAEQRVPVFNLAELRRLAVRQALAACDGHRGNAAALLGVSLGTMTRLAEECCPEMEQRTGRKRVARARSSAGSVSSEA
jgi:DNA-binding NtrC family response regulator